MDKLANYSLFHPKKYKYWASAWIFWYKLGVNPKKPAFLAKMDE